MHLQTSNVFNTDGIQHCDSPTIRALNRGRSNRKRAIQHQQNQIKKKLKSISDADRYRERIIAVRRMNQDEASRQAKHLGEGHVSVKRELANLKQQIIALSKKLDGVRQF